MLQGNKINKNRGYRPPFQLIALVLILVVIFVSGVLWRMDETLFRDRTQWLESQLRTQALALEQNFRNEFKFWKNLSLREVKSWPQVLAAGDFGNLEDSLVMNESQWGPLTKRISLLKNLRAVTSPAARFGNQNSLVFDVFRDPDQKLRGLIWIQQGSKTFFVVNDLDVWRTWIEAFYGTKAELFVVNGEGTTLLHRQKDYVGQKMTDHPAFQEMSKKKDLQQFTQMVQFADKKTYSVVAQKIPDSNLLVIASAPISSVLVGRSDLRWQIIIFALGILGLLIGGIVFLSPLTAEKLSEGVVAGPAAPSAGPGIESTPGALSPAAILELTSEEKLKIYKSVAAALGHEIRGPLSSILANAQSMSNQSVGQDSIQAILRETRSARAVLDKILGFSGQTVQDKIEMRLESPIRKVVKKWEAHLKAKDVELITSIEDSHLFPIDQEPLMKAMENLIRNAIEAMERKLDKQLKITLKADGLDSLIIVEDNGQGMYPEVLEKAKDPFFTTRSYAHHLGLGLSEADGIFGQHHAQMQIESQPGKGTRVEIRFRAQSAEMDLPPLARQVKEALSHPPVEPELDSRLKRVPELFQSSESAISQEAHLAALSLSPEPEPELPLAPDNLNDLFELGVEEGGTVEGEAKVSSQAELSQEPSPESEEMKPVYEPLELASRKVTSPEFVFKRRESPLDQVQVQIRRPTTRGT